MHPELKSLRNPSPEGRLQAAEDLADRLERGQVKLGELAAVLRELMALVIGEPEPDVEEAMLDALNQGMIRYSGKQNDFPWEGLLERLPQMQPGPLAQALPLITMSGREGLYDVIRPYTKHKHSDVREAAGFALDELEMMG